MAEQVDPIYCPRCNQPLYVRAYPGQLLNCRNCRSAFPAPRSAAAPSASAPTAESPAPPQRSMRKPPLPPPSTSANSSVAPSPQYTPPTYRSGRLSRAALWSLIFGILFFIPIAALLAIVLGVVGIAKTSRLRGRGLAISGLILGCLGLAFAALILPAAVLRGLEGAHRVKCASNLRQIGQAIILYANENRGALPPRLEEVLMTQDITPEVMICPSSSETPVAGGYTQQKSLNLQPGGHLSYVYLPSRGFNAAAYRIAGADRLVLVYEPLSHHKVGFNALFADGHVEFIYGPSAAKVEAELKAGQNPPPSYQPQGP
jgi:prepilin-type processing-associated H-X9-DG protein